MADLNKEEMGLILRVAKGDQQAFLTIYDRYSPRIYALTLHILGEPMLAEEVTQDTFIKFWGRARQYSSERGTFLVWLMTVARHTALDRLRLEGRRPMLSDARDPETVWPVLRDDSHNPDEARWKSLYFAVRTLPDDQRQVIDLAYYQGMSQSEIAAELGWPLGTVKTRMRAAMVALRQEWARGDAD